MVLYDLPVVEKAAMKAAQRFRAELLNNGFTMLQYSVYIRCIGDRSRQPRFERLIASILPEYGHVTLVPITDKQFSQIRILLADEKHIQPEKPMQLMLF